MATGRVPTTANSPLTAKGDLFGYSTTQARVPVGNNGETLVADSSTSTGLRYQGSMAAGKNAIINGNFDIWQRGTSFASTSGYYADRWTNGAGISNATASRQSTGAADGSQYYLRLTSTGASSYWSNYSLLETSTVAALWGKAIILSLKLRRNATFNGTGVLIRIEKSATVDAGVGASWTPLASSTSVLTATIPTGTTSADWYQATYAATVPNDGTANSLRIVIEYNGAVQNGSILEISQVQLEVGSVPTQFTRAGGTIQGELAACQRYYWRNTLPTATAIGYALGRSTTQCDYILNLPVAMRTNPTAVDFSGSIVVTDPNVANITITSASFIHASYYTAFVKLNAASGLTQGKMYIVEPSANFYIGFSGEL